jgi:hypothetical protein
MIGAPSGLLDRLLFSERTAPPIRERGTYLVILISFDIDGTLEVGDPPGVLTMEMVRRAQEKGVLIGSCSDRPISAQRALWGQHSIPIDFAVGKLMLPDVKAKFEADVYYQAQSGFQGAK